MLLDGSTMKIQEKQRWKCTRKVALLVGVTTITYGPSYLVNSFTMQSSTMSSKMSRPYYCSLRHSSCGISSGIGANTFSSKKRSNAMLISRRYMVLAENDQQQANSTIIDDKVSKEDKSRSGDYHNNRYSHNSHATNEQQSNNDSRILIEKNQKLDSLANKCLYNTNECIYYASECEKLYNEMLEEEGSEVSTVSFNTVLKAWNKVAQTLASSSSSSSNNEKLLFNKQLSKQPSGEQPNEKQKRPHVHSIPIYTARDAAEHATNLLLQAEKDATTESNEEDFSNGTIRPDLHSYNTVIDSWSKSKSSDGPQIATNLIKRMMETTDTTIIPKPDMITYNSLIETHIQCQSPDYMDKVLKIYDFMEKSSDSEHEEKCSSTSIKPTINTINKIINAYSKYIQEMYYDNIDLARSNSNNRAGANHNMVPVRKKMAKYAQKAHELLDKYKLKYEETNNVIYQPDVVTYTSLVEAYGRCSTYETTKIADNLVRELEALYRNSGFQDERVKPNSRTYNSLLSSWSKTKSWNDESVIRCNEIFNKMKLIYKNRLHHGGPIRNNEETTKPTTRTYNTMIQCYGRLGGQDKAHHVLRLVKEIRDLYKEEGDITIKPNRGTYNAAIEACSHVKQEEGSPTVTTDALKIAFAILKSFELDSSEENGENVTDKPNHVTYSTLMKCIAFLLPAGTNEKNVIGNTLFEKAKKNHSVDKSIIHYFKMAVDSNTFNNILQEYENTNGYLDYKEIPSEWKKNVK